MTFLHNLSVNALSTGLVFALGLVNQVLLANYLGDVGYGRLALWTNVALIAALVFGEWIRRGSTYVVGREQAAGAARDNALLYVLLLGASTALAAWLFRVALTGVLGEEVLVYWPFLALLTTCIVWQRSGQAILLGLDQVRSYALVPIVFIVVYMGGNALLWLLGSLQLATALNAFALAAALAALCAFILLWKHAGPFSWGDGQILKRTLHVGGRGMVSVVLVFLLLKSDFFLIQYFLGEAAVGTYRVAVNFADMMQRLPDVAGAVLLAKVVRSEDSGRLSLRVARGVLFFSLAAALFLLLVGPWVIGLLFPAYTAAYAPMAWMLPGLIFLGFGSVFNTKLAGLGYPPATQWAPALAFVLNLLLNVYLIPRLGLEGAALSTSISYALWATCISWAYMRAEKLRWCDIIGRLPN
jgi:O-antigen/teichoic acid export membrane protein